MRTYQTAMSDSRFRNERASHALLKRLSMHAALYVLPESDSFSDIAQGLHPIAAGLQKHPHLFLQEEPDADHYRELQTAFYPRVRHVYEQERRNGRDRTTLRKPFHLLIPPLQRSLGAFIRVSDVHHGFGVHAIPSRRTPDGEAPLLVRFGLGHGDVSMLNTNDNMRFPGKGFALSKLEPELLFPARPVDFKPGEDPFALYKGAWPSLGRSIDHLRQAQFIFSRGMMVIAGVDPERYTITRHGARLQYSLVVFNAHFENPFNEVALLVPTELLRDFFKGLLSSANDYRGFNSQRPNALERIPNPRIFQRHPTLGRYVINVGLPESVMLGVTDSLSNEHHGWLKYRRDAMEYERRLRAVDRGFAARALGHGGHPSFFSPTNSRGAAQQLFNYTSADGAPELPRQNDLFSEEAQLIRERGGLIARFEQLDSLNDPLERNTWQCVNRLMELYDVFRVGFAYYTRGMTTPRSETPPEELERELGDADAAGFNPGGDLMLNELYRGHALHGFGGVNRERFPILLDADALFSSRFRHSSVMIDSFDMRGFVNDRPVQFSPGEITPEDIGAWQAGVLPHVRDTAGNIPELRLVERGMLPKLIVEKLDKRKGR